MTSDSNPAAFSINSPSINSYRFPSRLDARSTSSGVNGRDWVSVVIMKMVAVAVAGFNRIPDYNFTSPLYFNAGASGFTSGPKYRNTTNGSVADVFSNVTPALAADSVQKTSSAVRSWKRISWGQLS